MKKGKWGKRGKKERKILINKGYNLIMKKLILKGRVKYIFPQTVRYQLKEYNLEMGGGGRIIFW